jgi:NAD(P)-dependent dehydrogenase (short-subunit alcohol dehydrogenase family)
MSGDPSAVPGHERAAGRLTGRTALVVGGGSTRDGWPGTGSATARLLAAAGARVAVMGRSRENTERAVAEIAAAGGEAIAVLGDAAVDADAARVAGEVQQAFGGLDVLVNNLGIGAPGGVADLQMQDWDRVVATNLTSVLRVARHTHGMLAASPAPSVVNIGSVAGLRAGGTLAYGITKGALVALTREMAMDLGSAGIRVNLVVPGHLHTPMGSQFGSEDARRMRNGVNMLAAEGSAWDVAWAVLFLAGPESRFVTSTTLVVDAGATDVLPLAAVARDRARQAAS